MSNPFRDWKPEDVARHNAKAGGVEYKPSQLAIYESVRQLTPNAKAVDLKIVYTEPVAAPRMTRRDKWLKPRRPCVERYFQYRDKVRDAVGDIPVVPDAVHCRFYLPMPESWSKKKQKEMDGKPHRQRPDRDNLDKAIMDALFLEDGGVWKGSQEKYWCKPGEERVELTFVYET